jgi:ribonucleoside-diphosphate reductase alpha chain
MANEEFVEKLIKERYCANDDERREDSWDHICCRVAEYLGKTDDEFNVFRDMMYFKNFLPNSPTLMNAGTATPMLSACFYLPISDCISNGRDGIFDQVKNAALIFKYGGGVGLNFSNLRPAGSKVKSTQGVSSGVISFMKNFNTMTETIKQGGKRRGALMGCLDITHPEAKSFISCKNTEGDLSNFNISVKLTDEFMKKVENNSKEELELFNLIIDGIYKNGEPGILFKDEIELHNPNKDIGELNPNPCAEALLLDFESCNLGSINWSKLYKDSDSNSWYDHIDWEKYEQLIRDATIFLNRVIEGNQYPLPEIDAATKLTRKIGLGGMGFHDLLLKLHIPYDSEQAVDIAKKLETTLKNIAYNESIKNNFKNSSLTTIAPTGTISIIADVSSGIEPVFNWVITRKDSLGEHYIVHPLFDQELKKVCSAHEKAGGMGILKEDKSSENKLYVDTIAHCHKKGTIRDIEWLPENFKELFKNAMDINWKQHIKMQAVFQTNGVDMSISKTINLPNNATKSDIREAIFMAWRMKCKGITIYRSGSRELEVLNVKKEEPAKIQELRITLNKQIEEILPSQSQKESSLKRPRHLYGITYKVQSGCGKLYVTINERNGKPYEVFIQSGGSGGCEAGNQALGRTISLALRSGGDIQNIIKQLNKVKCPAALRNSKSEGKSCSDIVGRLLIESIPDSDEDEDDEVEYLKKTYDSNGDLIKDVIIPPSFLEDFLEECPECHKKTLVRESGCKVCHSCGYNKCG